MGKKKGKIEIKKGDAVAVHMSYIAIPDEKHKLRDAEWGSEWGLGMVEEVGKDWVAIKEIDNAEELPELLIVSKALLDKIPKKELVIFKELPSLRYQVMVQHYWTDLFDIYGSEKIK